MGGADLSTLVIAHALHEMGFKITLVAPVFELKYLKHVFGMDMPENIKYSFLPNIFPHSTIFHTVLMHMLTVKRAILEADIVIDGHTKNPFPYFMLSRSPLMLYIHDDLPPYLYDPFCALKYPLRTLKKILFVPMHAVTSSTLKMIAHFATSRSVILVASEFIKKAVTPLFPRRILVVNPPVDTQYFSLALSSNKREDQILIISRISPDKKLETAIELLKSLPSPIKMIIVGSLGDYRYLQKLKNLVERYKLSDRLKIKVNVSKGELREYMRTSKFYFHPKSGEYFGISIAEAMSAGLVPVVPDRGGHIGFVPKQFQYHDLIDAAEIILKNLDVPQATRESISMKVRDFSIDKFKSKIKKIIEYLCY